MQSELKHVLKEWMQEQGWCLQSKWPGLPGHWRKEHHLETHVGRKHCHFMPVREIILDREPWCPGPTHAVCTRPILGNDRAKGAQPGWSYVKQSSYDTTSYAGSGIQCLRPCRPEEQQPSMTHAPGHGSLGAMTFISKYEGTCSSSNTSTKATYPSSFVLDIKAHWQSLSKYLISKEN